MATVHPSKKQSAEKKESAQARDARFDSVKVLWYGVVTASVFGTSYSVFSIMHRFIVEPLATRITEVEVKSLQLPQMAICPFQPLNISKLIALNLSRNDIEFMHWHFNQEVYIHLGRQYQVTNPVPPDILNKTMWDKFVLKNSPSCENLLLTCTIDYQQSFNCCEYAHEKLHEKFGVCYVFDNIPGNRTQVEEGVEAGLTVLTAVPPTVFEYQDLQLTYGFTVLYDRELSNPFTTGRFSEALIMENATTSIQFRLTRTRQLGTATSQCTYKSRKCRKECFGEYFENFCNCVLMGFDANVTGRPVCNPYQVYICMELSEKEAYQAMNNDSLKCQEENCLPRCEDWHWDAQMSFGRLNGAVVRHTYSGEAYLADVRSYCRIRLYYGMLEYTEMEKFSIITFDNVLSQLGGLLSLWLGLSVLKITRFLIRVIWSTAETTHERVSGFYAKSDSASVVYAVCLPPGTDSETFKKSGFTQLPMALQLVLPSMFKQMESTQTAKVTENGNVVETVDEISVNSS